jgi:hypothetical protein
MRELAIHKPCIALADLAIQCKYSPIRHTQSNPTERVMRQLVIHEHCMADSAARFVYTLHVITYPSPVKQSYTVRYARARNSRALYLLKALADLGLQCI